MATGFVLHPLCLEHHPGPSHPERPERLTSIRAHLERSSLYHHLASHEPRRATPDDLLRVHAPEHVRDVEARSGSAATTAIDPDTWVSRGSWDAALLAAGGVLDAVERVLSGEWKNAFCAVRPPGHHAERSQAMGFCLFNNVAVAAAALRHIHGIERVAILDWDVHHGNGTQHLFETDPGVFYASLHQSPLYPGTGARDERGLGPGVGTTLNRPLPPGGDDALWVGTLERDVVPALEDFDPGFVLISAGFDAHRADPLAQTLLSEEGFRAMTARMADLARRTAGGRLVSVLEGGYELGALGSSVVLHVEELLHAAEGDT